MDDVRDPVFGDRLFKLSFVGDVAIDTVHGGELLIGENNPQPVVAPT
jgi:hypothetical protein